MLEGLSEATGRDFAHLRAARSRTETGLQHRRTAIEGPTHGPNTSVVLMGSWGRAEVTAGSDDDFMVLVRGYNADQAQPSVARVGAVLDHPPGPQRTFAAPVSSQNLVQNIGLDADDNANLTRRMLFLLESTPVSGDDVYGRVRSEILDRYLDVSVKPYRPPRFLLNDIVRYWRTICVDFAGKERQGPEKWGLRNAKLRTSRKVLFASGFIPVLECFRFDLQQMRVFVEEQLSLPPIDRIAHAFLTNEAQDEGARALGAYDEFVGRMNDPEFRRVLQSVTRERADFAAVFSDVRRIGDELQAGLSALLYESTHELARVVRQYAIF